MHPARLLFWAAALSVLAALSLTAEPPKHEEGRPSTVVLTVGKPARCPADDRVTVTLQAVLADSRCPENVLCVRAGGVRLQLTGQRGTEAPATFFLDSDRGDGTAELCGLAFRLLDVQPGRKPGETLAQDRYFVTLEVGPIVR